MTPPTPAATPVPLPRAEALPGLTTRPLHPTDAATVHAVVAAEEVADTGRCGLAVEDLVADWARPGADLPGRTLAYLDGGRLVGFAELAGPGRADAGVLPSHHGRGIGTALARWLRERARAEGATHLGTQVPRDGAADRFLAGLGYGVRWTAWDLALPPGVSVPARPLPPGWTLHDADDAALVDAWRVVEAAFSEWGPREPVPLEDFRARVRARPGAAPWNLRVARDAAGAVRGAAHVVLAGDEAHVARLAVAADARGRGVGQALLADALTCATAHGARRSTLSTDSRGSARSLYERVGMVVESTWVQRVVEL